MALESYAVYRSTKCSIRRLLVLEVPIQENINKTVNAISRHNIYRYDAPRDIVIEIVFIHSDRKCL